MVIASRVTRTLLLVAALCLVGGCDRSGMNIVPVSGVVTLNGKPLPQAHVSFAPQQGEEAPTSEGRTDANGRYTLEVSVTGDKGAMVGKHLVRIRAVQFNQAPTDDSAVETSDPVPARYNAESELMFEVPAGGTDAANFELTSP